MTSQGSCLKCGSLNSRSKYACENCGARLPWAEAAKLGKEKILSQPRPTPKRPLLLILAALSLSGAIFAAQAQLVSAVRAWHWPNDKPRPVQEDEIRIAAFKEILPASSSRHRSELYFLSIGRGLKQDPDDFVMQQLADYYPNIKKVSQASIPEDIGNQKGGTDRETGHSGTVLFVALEKFGQDKAQVRSGYWAGPMMSCDAAVSVEWNGSQWIVGAEQDSICS